MKIQNYMALLQEEIIQGFTLSLNPNGTLTEIKEGDLKEGYLISMTNNIVKLEEVTDSYFIRFLDSVRLLQTNGDTFFIGGWKDTKTDNIYLDISMFHHNKEIAYCLKHLFKQKSIFNTTAWECE